MPSTELKRIFQAGKMNRDLDDRLVPNGEYREGLNINIGRSDGSDIGAVENLLGNEVIVNSALRSAVENETNPSTCIGSYRDNGNERIYYFITDNNSSDERNGGVHGIFEFNQTTRLISQLASGAWLNFHTSFRITGVNFVDDLLFWTDNRNQPRKINVTTARNARTYYTSDDLAAVAKHAPYLAPTVRSISSVGNDSNFLQDKLPRFAYRWRFEDGEFSTISPFTPIIFRTTIVGPISGAEVPGEIPGLINAVKQVRMTVPTPDGFGITEVELLYKETANGNVYIIEDAARTAASAEFLYNSQDPFRTLPGSQLTRVYDAVPRLAQAQEFAGGRIVYGNFLQNYNLPSVAFTVDTNTLSTRLTEGFQNVVPNFSVKSRRTYQVGVVLADKQGRQSPVILSSTGNDTIFVDALAGVDRETIAQQLRVSFTTELPSWAFSYRIVVKQREQEYYNVFAGTSQVRSGDTINKIPRDPVAGGTTADASVYIKVDAAGNNLVGANSNNLIKVRDVSLVGASPQIFSNPTGQVLETEPFNSALDIFFETSTGGLVPDNGIIGLVNVDFFNCYLLNFTATAHIEINRLRAGFNEAFFDIGVKAYIVDEDFAGEERRFNTLIHSSGLFNSRTGINQSNQFNEGEGGITLSLDPQDGSIQKMFAEDTQMLIFQEDKVSRSPIDKDFIYSAEGGQVPVTSNAQYLGTVSPYAGEYGISRDPDSFVVYGTRKYFTDRNRGVVMRLSQDGLTEISGSGMSDFFRSILRSSTRITASFDEFNDSYNLTVVGDNYTSDIDTNIVTAGDGYFTIAFEEDVRGWSSFYSFEQESGTTLNNTYYTFNGGDLWEHNSDNVARNQFYRTGTQDSSIEFIFNDNPSIIKKFKTLSYEGTAGWDCTSLVTDIESFGEQLEVIPIVSATLQITQGSSINNARVSGDRTISGRVGDVVTWIIRADPETTNFEFPIVNPDFSLTNVLPNSDLIFSPATVNDGIAFITATYTLAIDGDVVIPVIAVANPASAFVGNLLILNFLDNLERTSLSPSFIGLSADDFTAGVADVTLSVIPEIDNPDSYSFSENAVDDGQITHDIEAILGALLVPGSIAVNRIERPISIGTPGITRSDVDITFMVNQPDVETTRSVTIDGTGPTLIFRSFIGNFGREIRDDAPNSRPLIFGALNTFQLVDPVNLQQLVSISSSIESFIDLRAGGSFNLDSFIVPTRNFQFAAETDAVFQNWLFFSDAGANTFQNNTNAFTAVSALGIQLPITSTPTYILEATGSISFSTTLTYAQYVAGGVNRPIFRGRLVEVVAPTRVALTGTLATFATTAITAGVGTSDFDSNTGTWEVFPGDLPLPAGITITAMGTIIPVTSGTNQQYDINVAANSFPAGTSIPIRFGPSGPTVDNTVADFITDHGFTVTINIT